MSAANTSEMKLVNVDDSQRRLAVRYPRRHSRRKIRRCTELSRAKRSVRVRKTNYPEPAPEPELEPEPAPVPEPQTTAPATEEPDENFLNVAGCFKVWQKWVATKEYELEKALRFKKLFSIDILLLSPKDLNKFLRFFVKEVRKRNGIRYAPDSIYYICLGIQQHLHNNGRNENIFRDPFYKKFTDQLDVIFRSFPDIEMVDVPNDARYVITRVTEDILWETKQLGAHSPSVHLDTLIYFNTKYFYMTTVEEHLQLSFKDFKHNWKKNENFQRIEYLRYCPSQSVLDTISNKKEVYKVFENKENVHRCPLKLYQFYSKVCPNSIKKECGYFYLNPIYPRSSETDVWYSTDKLERRYVEKLLNRYKLVKEIIEAQENE